MPGAQLAQRPGHQLALGGSLRHLRRVNHRDAVDGGIRLAWHEHDYTNLQFLIANRTEAAAAAARRVFVRTIHRGAFLERAHGVQLIQQALTRLPFPKIRQLWQLMAQLDHAQRHFDTEQAWLMLQTIALGFRDGTPLPLLETESC